MLTTDYAQGSPNWVDLGCRDVPAAAGFYGDLFGWRFEELGPEAGGYGHFTLDGRAVAAAGPLMARDAAPAWQVYFLVHDLEEATKAAEQAGGTVRVPPSDVFDAGRMSALTDPAGADFLLWEAGGTVGLDVTNAPGALNWVELYSTDAARALAFYDRLFSWDTVEMPLPGGGGGYVMTSPQGRGPDGMFGGVLQLPPENRAAGSASEWHPVFEVADVDAVFAKAVARGATSLYEPMDLEGAGRLAMIADPEGAMFTLIKPAPAAA